MPVAHACNHSYLGGRRISVRSQPGQIVCETLSQKTHHKKRLVGGSRWRPWVQTPVVEKSKKQAKTVRFGRSSNLLGTFSPCPESQKKTKGRARQGKVSQEMVLWSAVSCRWGRWVACLQAAPDHAFTSLSTHRVLWKLGALLAEIPCREDCSSLCTTFLSCPEASGLGWLSTQHVARPPWLPAAAVWVHTWLILHTTTSGSMVLRVFLLSI
jgi:hypothetical protein